MEAWRQVRPIGRMPPMGKEAAVLRLHVARTKCINTTIALNTGCELQGATATSAFLDGPHKDA